MESVENENEVENNVENEVENKDSQEVNRDEMMKQKSKKIKKMEETTSSLISASQVITTMWIAVKELIENSLDADSSSIVINAHQNGLEMIEVIDNGKGIKLIDFTSLSKKHHTSKLQDFEHISSVDTLGFRGEALHSLSVLSDSMQVITSTTDDGVGNKLQFSHESKPVDVSTCSRSKGTTIMIRGLFARCPVRCHRLKDQLNSEFSQTIRIIQQYAVLNFNVKFNLNNSFQKRPMSSHFKTLGKFSMKENFCAIFGNKILKSLIDFEKIEENWKLKGFISIVSSSFASRSSNDRCFINVNNRPCDINSITKIVKATYQMLTSSKRYPFFLLLLEVPPSRIDVNITPDKRSLILLDERKIIESLEGVLNEVFSVQTRTLKHMQVKPNREMNNTLKRHCIEDKNVLETILKRQKIYESAIAKDSNILYPNHQMSTLDDSRTNYDFSTARDSSLYQAPLREITTDSNVLLPSLRDSDSCKPPNFFLSQDTAPSSGVDRDQLHGSRDRIEELAPPISQDSQMPSVLDLPPPPASASMAEARLGVVPSGGQLGDLFSLRVSQNQDLDQMHPPSQISSSSSQAMASSSSPPPSFSLKLEDPSILDDGSQVERHSTLQYDHDLSSIGSQFKFQEERREFSSQEIKLDNFSFISDSIPSQSESFVIPVRKNKMKMVTIPFNFDKMKNRYNTLKVYQCKKKSEEFKLNRLFRAKISANENQEAEDELNKVISKEMFTEMKICGQFNLGFIVTKHGDNIFVVDQHASDEKYNYEQLKKNTVIQSQQLVISQKLSLNFASEEILIDNLEIFNKNGFKFKIDHEAERGRISLIALPFSKNWIFGIDDIEEMIFMLTESPGISCRPSRVNKMFASRACRKSVMIGKALNTSQMKKIVNHMSEMDSPWNCPHGRPTMRHLVNLKHVT